MSASLHTSASAHRPAPTAPSAAHRPGRPASRRRRLALAAVAAGAALVLTACGGGDDDSADDNPSASASQTASAESSAEAGEHNAADVTFAQGMIPHHRQAVEMADMAAEQAGSPEVKKLAAKIKKAQDPEIRTLTSWLKSWQETVPEPNADGDSGHGGHQGMSGMMTEDDMEKLAAAKGEEFDTAFLTLMIEHHEGAVEMAKQQLAKGAYPPAKEMAKAIDASQSEEIAEMHRLLGHDTPPTASDEPAASGTPREQEGHGQQH